MEEGEDHEPGKEEKGKGQVEVENASKEIGDEAEVLRRRRK